MIGLCYYETNYILLSAGKAGETEKIRVEGLFVYAAAYKDRPSAGGAH